MGKDSEQIVASLFRTEYGKLVATLTRLFGATHIQLAEDIVQDTLIAALDNWAVSGVPTNPAGWLMQVAKRKSLNELKHNKVVQAYNREQNVEPQYEIDNIFLDNEIQDSQLRMIFTCCHPSLKIDSQIALTLKTLCGFGVSEVANALLTNDSTINKRLYRARKLIKDEQVSFDIPTGNQLEKRLNPVSTTLYLMFNEGYNSTNEAGIIQKELCLEAMRLTKILVEHFEDKKLYALLALMCFHVARFEARVDNRGAIILFEDQDRSLWNQELIQSGMVFFKKAIGDKKLTSYHIEARIAAEHCLSKSFAETNWQCIYEQYKLLYKLKANPVIKLNIAIIESKMSSIEQSLKKLDELSNDKALQSYHLLPATQGILYMKLNQPQKAIGYLEKAIKLNPSASEIDFLSQKIAVCKIASE